MYSARVGGSNRKFRFNMRPSISVLAVLCFLSCAVLLFAQKTPAPPKAADYEDADGYVVLSILLSRAHSEMDPSFLLAAFLLSPLTASGINDDSFQSCSRVPTEFASAAADFRDKNKQNWNLTKKINLKFSYKFTNLKENTPGWPRRKTIKTFLLRSSRLPCIRCPLSVLTLPELTPSPMLGQSAVRTAAVAPIICW